MFEARSVMETPRASLHRGPFLQGEGTGDPRPAPGEVARAEAKGNRVFQVAPYEADEQGTLRAWGWCALPCAGSCAISGTGFIAITTLVSMSIAAIVGTGFDKLAAHFLIHGDERLHLRALARHLDLSLGSLRRGLTKLEERGLVRRTEGDGQVYYEADLTHPAWGAIRILLRELGDPSTVVREALSLPGVKAAMIFGSQAEGTARPDSDIDVLVLADAADRHQLNRSLLAAESLLGREIDCKQVTPERLQKSGRFRDFVRQASTGPREYVVGPPGAFEELVK